MLAGMYLGRITQLARALAAPRSSARIMRSWLTAARGAQVLLGLEDADAVLGPAARDALAAAEFPTATLSAIDMDSSPGLEAARAAVGQLLGGAPSDAALARVREVCRLVALRAARLAAAGVFAVLTKVGPQALQKRCVVAVDGGASPARRPLLIGCRACA